LLNGSARRCSTTSTASSQMPGTDRIRFGSWPFESSHTRSMDEIPRHGCNCGMGMVIVALVYEDCRNSGPNLRGANCYSWDQFFLCKPWEALVRPSEALADYATLVRMDPLHAGSDTPRFLGRFSCRQWLTARWLGYGDPVSIVEVTAAGESLDQNRGIRTARQNELEIEFPSASVQLIIVEAMKQVLRLINGRSLTA
jgi:hypothetical protein